MQRPEQVLQRSILSFIRVQYPNAIVFHVANGGRRSKVEAAIFKGLGVRAGVADLCVLWKNGKVGFLEIKAGKGKLSEKQLLFMEDCNRLEIPWECVNSIEQVDEALERWGVS